MDANAPQVAHLNGQDIAYEVSGNGPPVLLLHGYPQTRAMWRPIAAKLSSKFTTVSADLRGYGDSSRPETVEDMSFRCMGRDGVNLMQTLGFETFHLVGHDRGARAAHRAALDAPDALLSLTVMDIVPTHHLLSNMTAELARAYYHWLLLAQPFPFPETLINNDPDKFFEHVMLGVGNANATDFDATLMAEYRRFWHDPEFVRCSCNDYRAAIDVDYALDDADKDKTVDCPALVLFGTDGAMGRMLDVPATWRPRLSNMTAKSIQGGHHFPEQAPVETASELMAFLESISD